MPAKNLTAFILRVISSGILATIISSVLDIRVPYAIEASVIGYACYSFVSLLETLVSIAISKSEQVNRN